MNRKFNIITGLIEIFVDIQCSVYKKYFDIEISEGSVNLYCDERTPILEVTWDDKYIKLHLGNPWANRNMPIIDNCIADMNKSSPYYYHATFDNVDDFGYFFVEKVM